MDDRGRNDGAALTFSARGRHLHRLTAIFAEASAQRLDQVVLEDTAKFLPIGVVRCLPITSEDEARNRWKVEAFVKKLTKPLLALDRREAVVSENLPELNTQLGHECGWIDGCCPDRGAERRQRNGDNEKTKRERLNAHN